MPGLKKCDATDFIPCGGESFLYFLSVVVPDAVGNAARATVNDDDAKMGSACFGFGYFTL